MCIMIFTPRLNIFGKLSLIIPAIVLIIVGSFSIKTGTADMIPSTSFSIISEPLLNRIGTFSEIVVANFWIKSRATLVIFGKISVLSPNTDDSFDIAFLAMFISCGILVCNPCPMLIISCTPDWTRSGIVVSKIVGICVTNCGTNTAITLPAPLIACVIRGMIF